MHLWELEFAVAVRIDGSANAVGGDELDTHSFGRIAGLGPHHAHCPAIEAALNRPLIRLSAIPWIGRRIFALDTAFSGSEIGPQIGDVGVRQGMAIGGHAWTAPFDLRAHAFVGYRFTRHQLRALIQLLQIRPAFRVFVMTHPALVEVNHFTASGPAVSHDGVVVQPEGPLEVVCRAGGIGNALLGRANGGMEPRRRAC